MKTVAIPADTKHLYLDEIAHLIADYFEPEGPNDPDSVKYWLMHIHVMGELEAAARNGDLNVKHPMGHGPFPLVLGLERAVVLPMDVVSELASRGIALELKADTQPQAEPLPLGEAPETKEQRQDRRLQACIDAGLSMDTKAALSRLPYGVGDVADSEGVTRQAFSTDVKAALKRRESARREGATVHRA